MNNLAENLKRLRKESKLTQTELAKKLNVSFQAVSKWENEQTFPDIMLLEKIANLFEVSIDSLLGYTPREKKITIYEDEYKSDEYYWGLKPNEICYEILKIKNPPKPWKLLDIGCGEGKDALFMARNGLKVTAFDLTKTGIKKTKILAEKYKTDLDVFQADINLFKPKECYDVYFSSGVLHYLKPELRAEILSHYQKMTNTGGIHVLNVFVEKPFIEPAPEKEENATKWISGELLTYYKDWRIIKFEEIIFDCNSSGIPHKHAMNVLIAEKK